MGTDFFSLFQRELIFFEAAATSEEILSKVGKKLANKNLVTQEFVQEIVEREKKYPTGLDLRMVDSNAPFNIAIPHTEREYCNCKKIVVVKLVDDVVFQNMISPVDSVSVKYLFMILNHEDGAQANILAEIMDAVNKPDLLQDLARAKSAQEIYMCIEKNIQ